MLFLLIVLSLPLVVGAAHAYVEGDPPHKALS